MNRKIGVILSYILMVFEVLSTLLLTPFIIRTIGQAEYGVYKLTVAITAYLFLLDLGIGNAVIKFAAQFRVNGDIEQSRKFLGVSTLYYILIATIVVALGIILIIIFPNVFSTGLNEQEIILGQKLLLITTINVAFTLGTSAYANIIIAYEKFAVSKGANIIQIIIRITLTVFALKFGFGSIGIVLINLLVTVIFRAFFVLYVLFRLKLKPKFKGIDKSFLKIIASYSTWILLQMIATQINAFVDQIIIGILVPASAIIIGIYGIGAQLNQYFQTLGSTFTGVLMPGIVKMVEQKATAETLCKEMVRIGRIIFMSLSIVFVGFIIFGKQFISLWVGSDNSEAYYVAAILMGCFLFVLTESVGTQILWARNEHKEQALMKFIIVLLNVILTVFLVKWKPLLGAVIGTGISVILGDIVTMNIIFKHKLKISLLSYYFGLFRGIVPSLIVSGVCGVCFSLLNLSGWIGFICNICVLVISYMFCMLLFGFNKYEKTLIKNFLVKIFKKMN